MFSQGGRPAKKRVRLCCVEPSYEPPVHFIEPNGDEYRQLPLTSSERFALLAQYEDEQQQQQLVPMNAVASPQVADPWTSALTQMRATQKELEGLIEATDLILAIAAQGDESLATIASVTAQISTNSAAVVNQSANWTLFNSQTSATTSSLSSSTSSTSSALPTTTSTTTSPSSQSTPSTTVSLSSATTKDLVIRVARKHQLLELGSSKLLQKSNELKQLIIKNKASTRNSLMARKTWVLPSMDKIDYSWRYGSLCRPI
eukprot:TRINITY_DN4093_c0_g1_i3.p1 TRINITY_DN4093_c0_g1~~TRINITY_DN4093_c0_g1_i3.p1  ORF type:complete len:259 (-),score=43.57 TRINITY_DN4093_c0_g1_i3:63-839(-)